MQRQSRKFVNSLETVPTKRQEKTDLLIFNGIELGKIGLNFSRKEIKRMFWLIWSFVGLDIFLILPIGPGGFACATRGGIAMHSWPFL